MPFGPWDGGGQDTGPRHLRQFVLRGQVCWTSKCQVSHKCIALNQWFLNWGACCVLNKIAEIRLPTRRWGKGWGWALNPSIFGHSSSSSSRSSWNINASARLTLCVRTEGIGEARSGGGPARIWGWFEKGMMWQVNNEGCLAPAK